jgi:hypothetical protein
MRRLAEPKVVTEALVSAALTAVLCLPAMWLWEKRPFSIPYIEATIFLGGFVLWAFVFAWHTQYTRRPVFTLKIRGDTFAFATLAGVLGTTLSHFFFDPSLRMINPLEYPTDFDHWIASTLFTLVFAQLFLLFAPFAWLIRLFRNEKIAMGLTVAFGVAVWLLKVQSSPHPLPSSLFAELFAVRIVQGLLGVWFYLRGGILLTWWLGLLFEARHLFDMRII